MALSFILGGSGSGKSSCLFDRVLKEAQAHRDRQYLVLVPEQFTLQTQRDLVRQSPDGGIMNVDVLSFVRLAYRIFDEIGGIDRPVLDDTGKNMMLRRVIASKERELAVFGRMSGKPGFIEEVKSMISELYQYGIDEDQLEELSGKTREHPMLSAKLTDIEMICRAFADFKEDHYITAEEILILLGDVIPQSKMLQKSTVCFDGYTGFTPVQYRLLSQMMPLCGDIYVTVTIDPSELGHGDDLLQFRTIEETDLFAMSKTMIRKLTGLAEAAGTTVGKPVILPSGRRFGAGTPLEVLEQRLFRRQGRTPVKPECADGGGRVLVRACVEPEEETLYVLSEIRKLVQEQNYRYREIAIVTGDMSTYGRLAERMLTEENIPCFLDQKEKVQGSPVVEYLLGFLAMAADDFRYQDVFRYLRCGLGIFSEEETDELENAVLEYGIRGFSAWGRSWYDTSADEAERRTKEEKRNALREKFLLQVSGWREKLLAAENAGEITDVLYRMMAADQVPQRMKAAFDEAPEGSEIPVLLASYEAVYKAVVDLMDQMVLLLGSEKMPLSVYAQVLQSGFDEVKVGRIPPSVDRVTIGDINRTRLAHIRALFFIGVNDGIVPPENGSRGLLSENDREILAGCGAELAPNARQEAFAAQFYLYWNLTKPSERLYITYARIGTDGKTRRPSFLIRRIRQVFPAINLEEVPERNTDFILASGRGISCLSDGLREFGRKDSTPLWKELYHWYAGQEEETLAELVQAACFANRRQDLSDAAAVSLYGTELSGSVTRLEQFAACPYSYFAKYGLDLYPRREWTVEAADFGSMVHAAVEEFGRSLSAEGYTWGGIGEDDRKRLCDESMRRVGAREENRVFFKDARTGYLVERMRRMLDRTTWALCRQVRTGRFEPEDYELEFNRTDAGAYPLPEGRSLSLRGKIDRLDVYREGSTVGVKVLDYKTGKMNFDLTQVTAGLQLQLVVYMKAALHHEEKKYPKDQVQPGGVLYYQVKNPYVKKSETEDTEEAVFKALRPNGEVNAAPVMIGAMDRSLLAESAGTAHLMPSCKSKVIPVETTKDGSLGARSSVLTEAQFRELMDAADRKIAELAGDIMNGRMDVSPYELKGRTACTFCDYRSICGFDRRIPGYEYRKLKQLKKDEILKGTGGGDG